MPTIPWLPGTRPGEAAPPDRDAYVMASRLEVKSLLNVPRFFLQSMVVWRQVRQSPGLLGVSLRAEPLKRTFWTLSAWEDQKALAAFNRTDPHASSVMQLRKVMRNSVFTFWNTSRDRLPIDWDEATRRLAEAEAERESGAAK